MTVSIQTDAGAEGAGDTVDAATVQLHLIAITRDTNIGEGPLAGDLAPVTYVGAPADAPATQISTLVNSNFNVKAGRPDIIVVGVGPNFTLLDGTVLCGNGVTIFPTAPDSAPGQVNPDNPTGSIYIIYDVTNGNGGGILVRAPGGGGDPATYTTPTPSSVVLFHELSHALRLAQAAGVRGVPPQQADDEVPAINDENVLRPILGIGLRDPNPPHDGRAPSCGGAPGPNGVCCIVASISTGSPYSEEVNALRRVRDGVLRQSDVGYDFFQHLHYDYYAFSPEVCRLMARSPDLQERVRRYFVVPLARILKLAYDYAVDSLSHHELGVAFDASVRDSELALLDRTDVDEALVLLGAIQDPQVELPPLLEQLAAYLDQSARASVFVRWALLEPLEIHAKGMRARLEGFAPAELGRQLARAFDDWGTRLPLTDAWCSLSELGLARELAFIKRVLVREPAARNALGLRLAALLKGDERRLAQLQRAGLISNQGGRDVE